MIINSHRIAGTAVSSIAGLSIPTTPALTQAASVRLTGGGTAGKNLQIEILEDITISTISGSSFGGYNFGFVIMGALTSYDEYNRYNMANSAGSGLEYVTATGIPVRSLEDVGVSTCLGNLRVYFSGTSYPEVLIGEGGSITLKAGTITLAPAAASNVLANPGHVYDIAIPNFYSDTEAYPSLSPSNAVITSIPTVSSTLLIALGACGAIFRRRR